MMQVKVSLLLPNGEHVRPYQRGRALLTGWMVELREVIETRRLVGGGRCGLIGERKSWTADCGKLEIATTVTKVRQLSIDHQPNHPADVPATLGSIRSANRELGWAPTIPFPNGPLA